MVTITVAIYPERAASIRAGLDPATTSLEVDLDVISQEERDLLADHGSKPVYVATPTLEHLFEELRAATARESVTLAEILEAHREALRERRVTTWQEQVVPSSEETYPVSQPEWPKSGRGAIRSSDWTDVMVKHRAKIHEITHGDEAGEWVRELDGINKKARERAFRDWQEAEAAKDRAREEGIARLKEWAVSNGSERVRLLIEENMASWYGVAEDEFFADHIPAGFALLTDEDFVRSLPAPDAVDIRALREARHIAAEDTALGAPHLVWIGKIDGPDKTEGHPAVRLSVTGPHGAQCLVWRAVAEDSPADLVEHGATTDDPTDVGESTAKYRTTPLLLASAIEDLRHLINAFDDAAPAEMGPLFYAHAHTELIESGRRLIAVLGTGPLIAASRELLGDKLVAYLGAVPETRIVRQWAEGTGSGPTDDTVDRLRTAYRTAALLADRDSPEVIQAWFQGINPGLDDAPPARLLREGNLAEVGPRVLAAAVAHIE